MMLELVDWLSSKFFPWLSLAAGGISFLSSLTGSPLCDPRFTCLS